MWPRIRARNRQQTAPSAPRPATSAGRYLSLRERLQIADLLRLDYSLRAIATELGRAPSTIKRELDRHRDGIGRYLPHGADHAARVQRRRPKQHKLIANPVLRKLVQRKLNRCWSPDEISGWLRRTYPDDTAMWLCPETIYRALLVPGGKGLNKRYCRGLRTGRRLRRSRWLTRSGHGSAVQNMTMIDKRPAVAVWGRHVRRDLRRRLDGKRGPQDVGGGMADGCATVPVWTSSRRRRSTSAIGNSTLSGGWPL